MKSSTKPIYSITLFDINPEDVIKMYDEKYFFRTFDTAFSEKTKFQKKSVRPIHKKIHGSTIDDGLFSYSDHTNTPFTLVCANQTNYENYKKIDKQKTSEHIKLKCVHCYCDIQDIKSAVNIPYKMYEKIRAYRDENGIERFSPHYIVEMFPETACSFEHAITWIKKMNIPSINFRDYKYTESRSSLLKLFRMCYPDKPYTACLQWSEYCNLNSMNPNTVTRKFNNSSIHESPNPFLLEENGGALSKQEFNTQLHTYRELPTVIIVPIKPVYIQQRI